jgi:signal transduction histidine kinase
MKQKFYTLVVNSNIYFWCAGWLCLLILYVLSIKYDFYNAYWDHIIYLVQLIADILIGLLSYLCFKSKDEKTTKTFYLLVFASLIPGLFANEMYNIIINILGVMNITQSINNFWVIAYGFFLSIQIFAWSYLLLKKRGTVKYRPKSWLIKFPHIQSVLIIIISFASIKIFRTSIVHDIGNAGLINTMLETVLFVLISMSLSKTKNASLCFLEAGFLLLIAFNLAHRFSYTTAHYFKTFDVIWLISLIIIIHGLLLSFKRKEDIRFFEPDSIHILTSAIFITFSTFLLVVFFIVDFTISSVEMNRINMSGLLLQNIPTILIFSYLFSLLTSKVVANYISNPLEEMSKRIDIAYWNEGSSNKLFQSKFNIDEIDKLDNFILTTIDQLQGANRVKSDFLMNMSHDFRTPASGIYHLSRSIYKRIQDTKLKALQKLVVDSSEQLMNFIDDVLDYSKLDNNQLQLNISVFNIKELVNEVVLFVLAKAEEKSVGINITVDEDVTEHVGDRLVIHRIILNIVSNAIKFTHKGHISIHMSKDNNESTNRIIIKIKDTGIGIDKKNHKLIFEPFHRVESTDTAKYPGIGLGLSNIKLMLKKIGGEILLDSSLGQGATFTIFL